MIVKVKLLLWVIAMLLCVFTVSEAQVGLAIGNEYGMGLIAQVGPPEAKVKVGGGLVPLELRYILKPQVSSETM